MRIALASLTLAPIYALGAGGGKAIDIGSRLELLVDEFLIDTLSGGARLELHRPARREVVMKTDEPWGGNASGYQSVFKDGDLYRMYYRGGHYRHSGEPAQALADHPWVLCYAESDDGIHWRKPELGLFEFNGSKANNIVVNQELIAAVGGCPAHTAVLIDSNPDCPPDEKYKIVALGSKPHGLYVLKSADGIRFSLMSDKPIVTKGAFDSQNLLFWDSIREEYREYHRGFNTGGVRDIMTSTAKNLWEFPEPQWLRYPGSPTMALYTNQIQPYYRAPHIFMGFPMRYNDRGWSEPMLALPGLEERLARAKAHRRYGTTVTDAVFMSSRDGRSFKRWSEAFIRPGPDRKGTWVYGDNFIFWGMVETRSGLENAPDELSLYAVEGYWEGTSINVRRYTLRIDGFVSLYAPFSGGECVTKPLTFAGGNLTLNAATSAAGSIRVEIQDEEGNPIPGFELDDCPPIFCDDLRYTVRWSDGGDVRSLAGKSVRLRFVLRDADLYAFRFSPYAPDPERPNLTAFGMLPKRSAKRGPYTVLEDDFQAAEAGTSPTEEDLDPPAGDGDRGWVISEGAADRVQILNDDPVGSGKAGPEHYLKLERRAEPASQGGRAWIRFLPQDAVDTTRGIVEVKATIRVPSTNAYCVDIDAFDNPPNEYGRRSFHVRFYPDGRVTYYREKGVTIEGIEIRTDVWQDVTIRADLDTGTFELTIGDRTVGNLPFATADLHRIQTLYFGPNTSNCTLYVKKVLVRVTPRSAR